MFISAISPAVSASTGAVGTGVKSVAASSSPSTTVSNANTNPITSPITKNTATPSNTGPDQTPKQDAKTSELNQGRPPALDAKKSESKQGRPPALDAKKSESKQGRPPTLDAKKSESKQGRPPMLRPQNQSKPQSDLDSGSESDTSKTANNYLEKLDTQKSAKKPLPRNRPLQNEDRQHRGNGIEQMANQDFIENHLQKMPTNQTMEEAAIDIHRSRLDGAGYPRNNTVLFSDNVSDTKEALKQALGRSNNPDPDGKSDLRSLDNSSFFAVRTRTTDNGATFQTTFLSPEDIVIAHNEYNQASHLESRRP